MKVPCIACGEEADPEAKNTAHEVLGWVVPRSAGGTNHIRYQEVTGQFCHVACLEERVKQGGRQELLF